jgi:hypothetical protein
MSIYIFFVEHLFEHFYDCNTFNMNILYKIYATLIRTLIEHSLISHCSNNVRLISFSPLYNNDIQQHISFLSVRINLSLRDNFNLC